MNYSNIYKVSELTPHNGFGGDCFMKRYKIIGKDNKMYNRIYSLIFSKQKDTCRYFGCSICHSTDMIVSTGGNIRKLLSS